jgi:hypothetical protein
MLVRSLPFHMQGTGAPFPDGEEIPDFFIAPILVLHAVKVTFGAPCFASEIPALTPHVFSPGQGQEHYLRKLGLTQSLLSKGSAATLGAIRLWIRLLSVQVRRQRSITSGFPAAKTARPCGAGCSTNRALTQGKSEGVLPIPKTNTPRCTNRLPGSANMVLNGERLPFGR